MKKIRSIGFCLCLFILFSACNEPASIHNQSAPTTASTSPSLALPPPKKPIEMPDSIQQNIDGSLSRLKEDKPLTKSDFVNISWAFAFHPDQDRFLLETNSSNKKLAESLLIFRKRLNEGKIDEAEIRSIIDQVFLHYVVNTKGKILQWEGEDPFDVFGAATRYAQTLSVGVGRQADGTSLLILNDKEIACPNWGTVDGWSAAWSLRKVGPVINRARYGRDDVIPSTAFGFDEEAKEHSLSNAMTFADFSHLAYFSPAYIEKQVQQWGYTDFRWIEDEETDTQAFVSSKDKHVIVCFRGTGSMTDWITDLKLRKTDAFGGKGRVHRGFKSALDSVWDKVQTAVNDLGGDKKVFVSGHSLGAALAQLAAYRLASTGHQVASVYVYGSPRVGNRGFKKAYDALLKNNTFLHINNKDIVPQVPPRILGFRHLGETPRVFDRGHVISESAVNDNELSDQTEEKEFDELSPADQQEIKEQLQKVKVAMEASTRFLNTPPQLLQTGDYTAIFEEGVIDDHSMDQYLFKFGCAIIEGEWKRIGENL